MSQISKALAPDRIFARDRLRSRTSNRADRAHLPVAGELLSRPRFLRILRLATTPRYAIWGFFSISLYVVDFKCALNFGEAQHPFPYTIQIAFVLLTRSGAPGGIRTPGLLVRSQWSQNAKCPIWRRLRTGNAILHSISCTQTCTQNQAISTLHRFNPKSRVQLGRKDLEPPTTKPELWNYEHQQAK